MASWTPPLVDIDTAGAAISGGAAESDRSDRRASLITSMGQHLLEFAETIAVTYLAIHWIGKAFQSYQNTSRGAAPKVINYRG